MEVLELIVEDKTNRLKELRKSIGMNQTAFAEAWGINQSNLSKLEKGERPVGKRLSNDLITLFNVNPNWWETGEGPMFNNEGSISQTGKVNTVGSKNVRTKINSNNQAGPSSLSATDQLLRLADLVDRGLLTEEEFTRLKKDILK